MGIDELVNVETTTTREGLLVGDFVLDKKHLRHNVKESKCTTG